MKLALPAVFLNAFNACAAEPTRPLLIQWGQTTPDTTMLARHHAYWESYLPFDGLVLKINQKRYSGRYGTTSANILRPEHWPLDEVAFHHRKIDRSEYQHVVDNLQSIRFTKFKHNFIQLGTYPHMQFVMDWFDDALWDRLLHNVGVVAWVARESGCRGIWFDTEQYGPKQVWNYQRIQMLMPDRAAPFDVYRAKAMERGEQFMRALNRQFPGINLVLAFGNCIIHDDMTRKEPPPDVSHARYTLLAPFIDGMLRAADEATTVTDAFELSYFYKEEQQFIDAVTVARNDCSVYSADPDFFRRELRVGFGLYPTHVGMFNPRDFTNNKYQPEDLRRVVRHAMVHTDRYAWIWSERYSFWIKGGPDAAPLPPLQPAVDSDNGDPGHLTAPVTETNAMRATDVGVPEVYIEAIRQGKSDALRELGFSYASGRN